MQPKEDVVGSRKVVVAIRGKVQGRAAHWDILQWFVVSNFMVYQDSVRLGVSAIFKVCTISQRANSGGKGK